MAFPTLSVKDGNSAAQTVNTLPNAGQTTSANSLPVVLANDQSAVPVSLPAGVARTSAFVSATASGNVAAGAKSVSFLANGTAAPTVAGTVLPVGYSLTFSVDGNDTLAAIAYIASASASLLITTVV